LRLNLPETKQHDKPIVTLQPAVFVDVRLLAKQRAEGYGKPDDYLFLPELQDRKWLLVAYGWQFMYLQSLAGIVANAADGQTRTIYNLRYTAMTFKLLALVWGKDCPADTGTQCPDQCGNHSTFLRIQLDRRDEHRLAARQAELIVVSMSF
jgi:hypothetical protein